jgi:hypothetical protein
MIARIANDVTTICADQLTEGDIIEHSTGESWLVNTEPQYTTTGITFEVLCLDVEASNNTQRVSFAPQVSFVLLDYQSVIAITLVLLREQRLYSRSKLLLVRVRLQPKIGFNRTLSVLHQSTSRN